MKLVNFLKSYVPIIIGASILSFGTFNFHYRYAITEGGVLGLLLVCKHVFDISPSITGFIFDMSCFAFGTKVYGKEFLTKSITATISFSLSYRVWESIGYTFPYISNQLIISILAGIFVGAGVGIVVRNGGAAGGDDVIALVVSKYTPLKINHVYLLTDVIVLVLALATYLSLPNFVYSLVTVTVSGQLIGFIHRDTAKSE